MSYRNLWNNIKSPIHKELKSQKDRSGRKIFEGIKTDDFSNLVKNINLHIQELQQPNSINRKKVHLGTS